MKWLLMLCTLLLPLAFAGGYMLATANARVACVSQVETQSKGMPPVCADISSTGVTTALFFGMAGLAAWGLAWFVFARQVGSSTEGIPGRSRGS
jgi:hypothetical protein